MGSLKKIITTGVGAALMTENSLRNAFSEIQLTRQAGNYIIRQAQKGKDELTKALLVEFKKFLKHVDLPREIQKAIVGLTIDVEAKIKISSPMKDRKKPKVTVKKLQIK